MKTARTSFSQKAALILFGLVLTVASLEVGLRLGGFALSSIQEHRNRVSISKQGTYRILCLGESTTAGQYPAFLEEALNRRDIGIRFSVIDKGFVGTQTDTILSLLETNLDAYHPDMVITMMGVNDQGTHMPHETVSDSRVISFFKSCRTYKLAKFLWLHLATKLRELNEARSFSRPAFRKDPGGKGLSEYEKMIELGSKYREQHKFFEAVEAYRKAIALSPGNDRAYFELGNIYRGQGKFSETVESYKKAIELNPKNDQAFFQLGYVYRELRKFPEAEKAYKKAIELCPQGDSAYYELGDTYGDVAKYPESEAACRKAIELNPQNYDAYRELGDACTHQGKHAEAEAAYRKAIELNPQDYKAYPKLGTFYQKQGRSSEAVELFKKLIANNLHNDKAYGALGAAYREIGNYKLAKEYSDKAQELRLRLYDSKTASNYRKLREILRGRGVTYVCMQYPMRDKASLKKIFEGDTEGILFVDNERIFKNAVEKEGYAAYFGDMFAGDFGHCTPKGNRLLAENIADTILKEVFNQ